MEDDIGDETGGSGALGAIRAAVPDFVRKRFILKFALILAVMALTVALIGATATGKLSSQVEHDVEQEYEDLATQKATVVEKWIQRNSVSVKLASKNAVLTRDGDRAGYQIRNELATTGANLYGVQSIYLVNRSTSPASVVASPQFPFDTDVSAIGREWLENVSTEEMDVADVHTTDVHVVDGDNRVIAFVSPVQGTDDRYLVVEYKVQQLANSIDQDGISSRFTQVVDANGTVQVAARSSEILRQYGSEDALRPVSLATEESGPAGGSAGVIPRMGPHSQVLDEEYTVGYAPVRVFGSDLSWVVLVHEPTSDVFGFVQTISLWGRLSTLGGVVFIGLVGTAIGLSTTRDINRLRRRADEMREGDLDVAISSPRIDSIGQLYDGFDDMRRSLKEQIEAAEHARQRAEVSRAEAIEMNEYLQEKAEEYSDIMQQCAEGDLTQRLEPDNENDSMDRIAREFNDMVAELEKTTGQLRSFAEEVEHSGEVLQSSSESVKTASEHVASSVQAISDDAHDQKEQLEAVSAELDDLVDLFDEYAAEHDELDVAEPLDNLEEIAQTVSRVAEISEQTLAETELVAGAAEEQAAELNEVTQRANDLTQYAGPLSEVLDGFETETEREFFYPNREDGRPSDEGPISGDD
ncbi:HAMP domain-containing protein [Halosimplex aquaticum]|uniref:HAMP domain-containing protein n=1 Tax=Halosimplex aquaticum TaxID=3026162 RepID=A0ABD5Y052_9EURY|nr:HAMP domain-containing protein [Halosimplex aquaticum]